MSELTKLASSAAMVGGAGFQAKKIKTPDNIGRNRPFFTMQTQAYAFLNGGIADNVYDAICQGLGDDGSEGDFDPTQCTIIGTIIGTTLYMPLHTRGSIVNGVLTVGSVARKNTNWYKYTPVRIRANPASVSSTGEIMPDDWLKIHILAPAGYTYIPPGAYIVFGGNTWIVYKSYNMSVGLGQAIIRRCNAVINKLDFYGNIVSIPISYSKMGTLGNASHATENSIVAKNYISCICQLNELSEDFSENTRLILGKTAYAMRGVNNFTREFTEDETSVHQITFTIERTETLPQDDLIHGVADGLSFTWKLQTDVSKTMTVGNTQQIHIKSIRNGVETDSTELFPISYIYESSDENILSVNSDGLVTANGEGSAVITVYVLENTNIKTEIEISVGAAESGVFFKNTVEKIKRFQSAVISAYFAENGVETEDNIIFAFSGVEKYCYDVVSERKNEITINCYALSESPLIVTAKCGEYSRSIEINFVD